MILRATRASDRPAVAGAIRPLRRGEEIIQLG